MYKVTKKSTAFGFKTPFGLSTPFRLPAPSLESVSSLLLTLAVQLYPTGRAWYMLKDSIMEKLHLGINVSFARFLEDAKSILNSCFPDNENFNEDDCALWEYYFGMVTNESLSVEVRREAIFRRMARGRNIPARQHIKYIEYQLRLAGFEVRTYENGYTNVKFLK